MLCPQLASAKYIDTWVKFIIIIIKAAQVKRTPQNSINGILGYKISITSVSLNLTYVFEAILSIQRFSIWSNRQVLLQSRQVKCTP